MKVIEWLEMHRNGQGTLESWHHIRNNHERAHKHADRGETIQRIITLIEAARAVTENARQVPYPGEDVIGWYTVTADDMATLMEAVAALDEETPQ